MKKSVEEFLKLSNEEQKSYLDKAIPEAGFLLDLCSEYNDNTIKNILRPYYANVETKHDTQRLIPDLYYYHDEFGINVNSVPQMTFNNKSVTDTGFIENVNTFGKTCSTIGERKVMYQYILDNLNLTEKGKIGRGAIAIIFVGKTCRAINDREVILKEFPYLFSILNESLKIQEPRDQDIRYCNTFKMVGWCLLENKVADLSWVPR